MSHPHDMPRAALAPTLTETKPSLPDDESSEQDEFDPRWEVQPAQYDDESSANGLRGAFIALAVIAVIVGLLAWLLIEAPPAL